MASTYRQMVFMVNDEIKNFSDDSAFTIDHIIFLLSKYRAFLIKQELEKNKEISSDNYQVICLKLEETNTIPGLPCEGERILKSTEKIPSIESGTSPNIFTGSYFSSEIAYVSKERFRYTGYNRWLQNIIYATVGPDDYLYLKSRNPQYMYLRDVKLEGIFEDPEAVSELLCNKDEDGNNKCDVLDTKFPLDDYLIPQCIQLTVKELIGAVYRPKDFYNNSSDELSSLATFLRNNMKSNLQKKIEGDD